MRDGVMGEPGSADELTSSQALDLPTPSLENYRIRFVARANTLTVSMWRVAIANDAVVESVVDLDSAADVQGALTVVDNELYGGRSGVAARTDGVDSSVLFEDISVAHPCMEFSQFPVGTYFGDRAGHVPGQTLFTDLGVTVRGEEFQHSPDNSKFGFGRVVSVRDYCVHRQSGHGVDLGNINFIFELDRLQRPVRQLTIDYIDHGGSLNIGANGNIAFRGWMQEGPPPTIIALGVTFSIDQRPHCGGENSGSMTFQGDLREVILGAQELVIDAVCVSLRPECLADFNGDGIVNSQDFFDFLTAFFSQAPAADFNFDGTINSQDFFDFLTAFFRSCD